MKDHMILVAPDPAAEYDLYRIVLNGMRDFAHPVDIPEIDFDREGYNKRVHCWMVEEHDVNAMVEHVTRFFPGRDVQVLKLQSIYSRPPGEMQAKTVTKDGILPV